jgi:uracil-DNA glycosylase family 4
MSKSKEGPGRGPWTPLGAEPPGPRDFKAGKEGGMHRYSSNPTVLPPSLSALKIAGPGGLPPGGGPGGRAPWPSLTCPLCPRLVAYREATRALHPHWFNAPVPSFGPPDARLLLVGMAPGVSGANRTGRPFTGDHAGILLYNTLLKFGFASGTYLADPADGLVLHDCRITNAARCVPPQNKLTGAEIATCNQFLARELAQPGIEAILAIGGDAHGAILRALGMKAKALKFVHGAVYTLPSGVILADTYHVSRYNTSTRRLTTEMFETVIADLATRLR